MCSKFVVKSSTSFNKFHSINIIFLGLKHRKKFVNLKNYSFNRLLIDFLFKKNFINDFRIHTNEQFIQIFLNKDFYRIYTKLIFISKPSKRVYYSVDGLKRLARNELIFGLVLTKYGFLSITECVYYNISGELIFILK